MNLAEKLLKLDKNEFEKDKIVEMKSKQLSDLFGEPTKIKIKAISPQEVLDITSTGLDDDGNPILKKSLSTNALLTAAAMVEPSLKDTELLKHLGAATPSDAALKLFKGEIVKIGAKVSELAGFENDDPEEIEAELKN